MGRENAAEVGEAVDERAVRGAVDGVQGVEAVGAGRVGVNVAGDGDDLGGPRLEVVAAPAATPPINAAPRQPVIVLATCSRVQRWASARIWFHSSLAAPPPDRRSVLGAEPGRVLARLAQVAGGVGDAFEHGADEMAGRRVRRHADEHRAGVGVPQRRPLAGEVGEEHERLRLDRLRRRRGRRGSVIPSTPAIQRSASPPAWVPPAWR